MMINRDAARQILDGAGYILSRDKDNFVALVRAMCACLQLGRECRGLGNRYFAQVKDRVKAGARLDDVELVITTVETMMQCGDQMHQQWANSYVKMLRVEYVSLPLTHRVLAHVAGVDSDEGKHHLAMAKYLEQQQLQLEDVWHETGEIERLRLDLDNEESLREASEGRAERLGRIALLLTMLLVLAGGALLAAVAIPESTQIQFWRKAFTSRQDREKVAVAQPAAASKATQSTQPEKLENPWPCLAHWFYMDDDEYRLAEGAARTCQEKYPQSPVVYYQISRALFMQHRLEEALEEAKEALQLVGDGRDSGYYLVWRNRLKRMIEEQAAPGDVDVPVDVAPGETISDGGRPAEDEPSLLEQVAKSGVQPPAESKLKSEEAKEPKLPEGVKWQ